MKPQCKIFVAGHRGLVGSAIVGELQKGGYTQLICRSRQELDLLDQKAVHDFFAQEKIDYVFLAAAKVGGIHANSQQQADFLYENLVIATNVIHAAATYDVEKLLFLGSSCIYPKFAEQPIREESLLAGSLEPTNEGYAIAKIAGMKLCEMYMRQYGKRFISAMPTNLYGENDNFHPTDSHVIPGMMRRFHEAKVNGASEVVIWGTGSALRNFLHADDLARALITVMHKYEDASTINVGGDEEVSIADLARLMKEVVGFEGELTFDRSKPDGTPRKVMELSKIKSLGWKPEITLEKGLRSTYEWALPNRVFDPHGSDGKRSSSKSDQATLAHGGRRS